MKQNERIKARELRKQGYSIKGIAKQLSVSQSSVSEWTRDIELTEDQREKLGQRYQLRPNDHFRKRRIKYQEQGRIDAESGNLLHLKGCMLYWAEGTKVGSRVSFVNGDPNMVKLFVRFLIECLDVDREAIKISIVAYEDLYNSEQIKQFWLSLLDLPDTSLANYKGKVPTKESTKKLGYGLCQVRVYKVEILQRIYGAIGSYCDLDSSCWL